jgi:hypothetical protein
MILPVTSTPQKILEAKPGCEFLSFQSDEANDGETFYISFGGADMTEGETPAPAGFRLGPGESLVLNNTSPLLKQAEVWAVATGNANLRVTRF